MPGVSGWTSFFRLSYSPRSRTWAFAISGFSCITWAIVPRFLSVAISASSVPTVADSVLYCSSDSRS